MQRILIIIAALIIIAFALSLTVPAPAEAQSLEYGCQTYGCLYSHNPTHYARDGDAERPLGIAHELLPEGGPDGRRFERVFWPDRYDPARRLAWDRLAHCESGGNWQINTRNGYYGGVQFSLNSWRAAGGQQYATYPHQATPEEQIGAAEELLNMQGRGAWPGCLDKGQGAPYPQ